MSVAELPPRTADVAVPQERTSARPWRFTLTLEQAAYIALFLVALLAHLYGLGDRALHHDETHHANFSWRIYRGLGYVHDPLLHGPFLYFANALVYFLFGDSDYTARLSVALFGSALVTLPYLIRREIGRGAALMAATYLLISPSFLYVGRFIRHDIFAVTFEMLTFVGIVRYASTRRSGWLYLSAAALGLMIATMESFFLFVAIFAPLLVLLFLWRVWKPGLPILAALGLVVVALIFVLPATPERTGDTVQRAQGPYVCPSAGNLNPPANPMIYGPGAFLNIPPLPTADNNYGLCVRNQPDNDFVAYFAKLGQFFGHPAVLMAMSTLGLGAAALYLLIWRRRDASNTTAWERASQHGDGAMAAFASLTPRRLLTALAIFFVLYGLLFSAFLVNPVGLVSGATGSVLYWLAQHDVQRGGQPNYYYLVLLSVYEPVALLWSSIGVAMVGALGVRGLLRRFRRPASDAPATYETHNGHATALDWSAAMPAMLVWWAIATVVVYSWAGEKMPWLTIHLALPLTLLGAWALARALVWGFAAARTLVVDLASGTHDNGEVWEPSAETTTTVGTDRNSRGRALALYLGAFAVVAIFAFVLLSVSTQAGGQTGGAPWVLPMALFTIAALTVGYGFARGLREAIGGLALAATLVLCTYTVRSSYQINYRWGDVPREMLIFVQTSPDVARVMERLEETSIRRTGGMTMPIWYDNETIWKWYTRRFTNSTEQQPTLAGPPGPEVQAVLMLQENIDSYPQNSTNLQGFLIQRYPLRWWFPEETYRMPPDWATAPVNENSPLLMRLLRQPFDGQTVAQTWQYLMYRDPPGQLGSTDFVLAIRPELAQDMGIGVGAGQR